MIAKASDLLVYKAEKKTGRILGSELIDAL
jgi:hypothetical protein